MKKLCAVLMCLFLAGCVQSAPPEDPPQEMETEMNVSDSMNIILSHEYGNFMVKWTSPISGGSGPLFDLEVLAEDPDYVPNCPVKIRTYAPYANALELTGYYVQENNYDGNLCFRIILPCCSVGHYNANMGERSVFSQPSKHNIPRPVVCCYRGIINSTKSNYSCGILSISC